MSLTVSRRAFLATSAAALPGAAAARYVPGDDGFAYEVARTDTEWREMLGEATYDIMRQGATEAQKSDPKWDQDIAGDYTCKGCDLKIYDSDWKEVLDKGWLFFKHGEANALLMGVDWPQGSDMDMQFASLTGIEVHCRRCGSHMGHILKVGAANGPLLHCINGSSLNFTARQA